MQENYLMGRTPKKSAHLTFNLHISLIYLDLTASESLEWLYDFFCGEWWPSRFPLASHQHYTSWDSSQPQTMTARPHPQRQRQRRKNGSTSGGHLKPVTTQTGPLSKHLKVPEQTERRRHENNIIIPNVSGTYEKLRRTFD